MQTEYEARFLAVDVDAIVTKLKEQSAVCVMPRTLMRRIVFKNSDIENRGGWLRKGSARPFRSSRAVQSRC